MQGPFGQETAVHHDDLRRGKQYAEGSGGGGRALVRALQTRSAARADAGDLLIGGVEAANRGARTERICGTIRLGAHASCTLAMRDAPLANSTYKGRTTMKIDRGILRLPLVAAFCLLTLLSTGAVAQDKPWTEG